MSWVLIGPVLAGFSAVLGAIGGIMGTRRGARADHEAYNNSLSQNMQKFMEYVSKENESLRGRVDSLDQQVRKCQDDKFEMQKQLGDWERKWEDKLSGTS